MSVYLSKCLQKHIKPFLRNQYVVRNHIPILANHIHMDAGNYAPLTVYTVQKVLISFFLFLILFNLVVYHIQKTFNIIDDK